ncbi:hypothetical protein [Raineyella fluvialis]|uniref:Uncharacterized protein n=1 Tax=Raineyella fluvialis TaxID=2662261 RepID=A0A5Q2FAH1_9ACTN|nr:hypothetical protein [Raineyella fluvialis]QGF22354.1 hypothetical protein Rai3103_00140 [Raineyella fluvialis]
MAAHELRWGEAVLSFDEDGTLVSLVHDRWGPYLAGLEVQVAGAAVTDPLVVLDEDEVEVHQGGPIQLDVRHTVLAGWDQRIVAVNSSGAPRAGSVRLRLVPARDCEAWIWSAGAEAAWIVAPRGDGPLLVVRQRQGATQDPDFLELGPSSRWETDERRLWHWQAGWLPDHQAAAAVLPPWWPVVADLPDTVPLVIDDLDQAVDDDGSLEVDLVGDTVEVLPGDGRHRATVRLNSARGTSLVEAHWAEPLDRVLQSSADVLLAEAGAVGQGRRDLLGSTTAAAVVLAALAGPGVGDPVGALDVAEASMAGPLREQADPEAVLACLGLHAATGERHWLERAADLVETLAPRPLGAVAAMNLVTTLAAAGSDPSRPAAALARAAAFCVTGFDSEGQPIARHVRVEYALVLGAGRWDAALRESARWLGRRLGGGLPGHPPGGGDPRDIAREVLLLRMLDERAAGELEAEWAVGPAELADRTTRRLLADLVEFAGSGDAFPPGAIADLLPPDAPTYAAQVLLPLILAQSW